MQARFRLNGLFSITALTISIALAAAPSSAAEPRQITKDAPSFSFDANWMQLPDQWVLGTISGIDVDRHDNVWIIHRPQTLPEDKRAKAAPPVLEFASDGRFIRAWGGTGAGYSWPNLEHSIAVDARDRVWITGSSRTPGAADHTILTFDTAGKFLRQIGSSDAGRGDLDTTNVFAAADLFVDLVHRDLYVADGYGNRRVIVFDTETGAFKRMWSAFGKTPTDLPSSPAFPSKRPENGPPESGDGPDQFRIVHGVELSRDGNLYVSDRENGRVQVFDRFGKFKQQVFIHRTAASRQSAAGLGLSADKAQRWLYVIDLGNSQMVVLDRKSMEPVADIGGPGKAAGQFSGAHLMAVNSKGVVYVTELSGGRVQKLTPTN